MGIFSFSLYLILGLCSLPSVAQKLSWSEWTFIQSVLGYLGLAMAGIHTFLLLVNSLCNDRGLACENFSPLNPELQLSKWIGGVPTRTCFQADFFFCFNFFFHMNFSLPLQQIPVTPIVAMTTFYHGNETA